MAVTFSIPSSPKKNVMEIDNFLGVDLSNKGANVSLTRSPNAPNMIRDVPGKVRKRMGYEKLVNVGNDPVIAAYPYKYIGAVEESDTYAVNRIKDFTPDPYPEQGYDAFPPGFTRRWDVVEPIPGTPCVAALLIKYAIKRNDPPLTLNIYGDHGVRKIELPCTDSVNSVIRVQDISTGVVYLEVTNEGTTDSTFNINELFVCSVGSSEPLPEEFEYTLPPEVEGKTFNADNLYIISSTDKEYFEPSDGSGTITDASGEVNKIFNTISERNFQVVSGNSYTIDCFTHIKYSASDYTRILNDLPKGSVVKLSIKCYYSTQNSDHGYAKRQELCVRYSNGSTSFVYPIYDMGYGEFSLQTPGYISKIEAYVATLPGYTIELGVRLIDVPYYVTKQISYIGVYMGEVTWKEISPKVAYKDAFIYSLAHMGNKLYAVTQDKYNLVSNDMGNRISNAWQLGGTLFIADGKSLKKYEPGMSECIEVYNDKDTYVPTITIAKAPSGGGTSYESLNLLSDYYIETFNTDGHEKEHDLYMSINFVADVSIDVWPEVWKLNSSGDWKKLDASEYTANRSNARITMNNELGSSPIQGEDNYKVKVKRVRDKKQVLVNSCTIGTMFGVNGAADRLFLSGNPDYPNYDWFSEYRDFTYFPDDNYSKIGSDVSAIIGYSHVGNTLATHKDRKDTQQSVIFRKGDLIDNKASFPVINALQGEGAVSSRTFAYLETEPLFLTKSGIYAITTQDITGDKYTQNRSFFLNGALTEENAMENAFSVVFKNMYFLFINGNVYVLDGLQATQSEKSEPYSTRQYVGYFLTDIHATCAWVDGDDLLFGDAHGNIYKFFSDETAAESYNDNGLPIRSWWETPDIDGHLFYKNKTFRYMAVRLKSTIGTKVKLWNQTRGIWNFIKESKLLSNKVFAFSGITFSSFTFNRDTSDPLVSTKLRVKKMDKARFKIENSNLNEPFGLQNIAFEYVESGNFKG